jgi:hypothetical protein
VSCPLPSFLSLSSLGLSPRKTEVDHYVRHHDQ